MISEALALVSASAENFFKRARALVFGGARQAWNSSWIIFSFTNINFAHILSKYIVYLLIKLMVQQITNRNVDKLFLTHYSCGLCI
jgi:hypothetical protein